MIYQLPGRIPEIHNDSYVAPSADIIGSVTLAAGSSIWFNAVLRGDNDAIQIGRGSNIQDGSVLHVDPGVPLTVGEHVTVGHSVMLHGCTIGNCTLIGIGSRILNLAVIGRDCLVGANTLVTERKTFPDRSLILGSPARVARELSDEEVEGLRKIAGHYVDKIALYQALTPVSP